MSTITNQFYSELPANDVPLRDLFGDDAFFNVVPADWHVIITDIKNSTSAVLNGLHETVNLIATGSIVTVLNIAFKAGITIPFFFGGDGATFLVPPLIMDASMRALLLYETNTLANFNLTLRVGTVPVTKLYEHGEELRISKLRRSGAFAVPVVLGNGLSFAEKLIKGENYLRADFEASTEELDLSGMQCRWDKIAPPESNFEVVTLLAIAAKGAKQSEAFIKVISHIDEIYGSPEKRQPISVPKLKLKTSFNSFRVEMLAKLGKIRIFKLLQNWFITLYGYIYFNTESGKNYLNSLVEMSDTLVIDGRINTVISGTETQRILLQKSLDALEEQGEILYGLYVSRESVMSCYVRNLEDDHIHFVDGSEGGYTKAAGLMKLKLR
ncbi:DUF3095 family protein [Pedobacter metabolipauper]|uniref:DUF3095 family protein n=1 Tax=Pedobacter metabolipauper TaxID=425513 RepID=A0A4R6SS86_9SPHI|nr:DUF3095 family protein [Pedobacter metabolipauper]TDQ07104.1 Protein of unknown function (DUF3095) [Pedobacter metabolipauper]